MKLMKLGMVLASLLAFTMPARAALVLDRTGAVSDLGFIWPNSPIDVDFTGFYGPQTYSPPNGLYFPPVLIGNPADGIPAAPFTYTGPTTRYIITLTTPSPLINGQVNPITAWEEDFYTEWQGKWGTLYGADDGGGTFDRGCDWDGCYPAVQSGNTSIFTFDSQPTLWWVRSSLEYDAHHFWLNDIEIMGQLDQASADGSYRIQVFASGAPEPATWAMLLLGFGGIGFAMRRRSVMAIAR